MKEIPLTQGKKALVDDSTYDWLIKYRWYAAKGHRSSHGRFYAVRRDGKKVITMPNTLLSLRSSQFVDHKNGDGLDNRLENLRPASRTQNAQNSLLSKKNVSGYKGVCWHIRKKRWIVGTYINKKRHHLGYFTSRLIAAHVYDEEARKHFGEFACVNFPRPGERGTREKGSNA